MGITVLALHICARLAQMQIRRRPSRLKIAAMTGHVKARHTLGMSEIATGRGRTERRAWKHFMIAAKTGNADSL